MLDVRAVNTLLVSSQLVRLESRIVRTDQSQQSFTFLLKAFVFKFLLVCVETRDSSQCW